ncbi:MAG: hypothetical protein HDR39_00545 [Treponema sp.]|nr:hypothetical protein [Treponema sp.]
MLKKKLSKIALLAAAAFMLAGLPACSGDDGDGNEGEYSPTVERKITLYKNGDSQGEKDSVAAALAAIPATGADVWEIKLTKGTYTESEQLTYNGSATVRITGGDGRRLRKRRHHQGRRVGLYHRKRALHV